MSVCMSITIDLSVWLFLFAYLSLIVCPYLSETVETMHLSVFDKETIFLYLTVGNICRYLTIRTLPFVISLSVPSNRPVCLSLLVHLPVCPYFNVCLSVPMLLSVCLFQIVCLLCLSLFDCLSVPICVCLPDYICLSVRVWSFCI